MAMTHDDTPDLSDHPFELFRQAEAREDPSEKRWLSWCKKVEALIGCSLDGDQDADGFSLDCAYQAFERGATAEAYAADCR